MPRMSLQGSRSKLKAHADEQNGVACAGVTSFALFSTKHSLQPESAQCHISFAGFSLVDCVIIKKLNVVAPVYGGENPHSPGFFVCVCLRLHI